MVVQENSRDRSDPASPMLRSFLSHFVSLVCLLAVFAGTGLSQELDSARSLALISPFLRAIYPDLRAGFHGPYVQISFSTYLPADWRTEERREGVEFTVWDYPPGFL